MTCFEQLLQKKGINVSVLVREPLSGGLQNDQWVSEEETSDPSPLPRIPGVGILVRPVPVRKRSAGGILIPDSFREDMTYLNTVGRVLALGELAFKDTEIYKNGPWVKPGDYIVYGKFAGQKLIWKGVRLLIMPAKAIELVVDKPEYLDSNFRE
jgi:co-chaperonin GroES (HSP10)